MERLLQSIKIDINSKIYLKDPESSELGKKIIQHSILLIDELGLENFNFKRLGKRIQSPESSIYRYFENKHKLLLYLTSWYWGWVEYQLVFETNSISDPKEKLSTALRTITKDVSQDFAFKHINEVVLNRILVNESSKSFLTKEVDIENKEGYFIIYKRIVARFEEMIIAVNEDYPYPSSLASTILETYLHQLFLKNHFPNLTSCEGNHTALHFIKDLVFKALNS